MFRCVLGPFATPGRCPDEPALLSLQAQITALLTPMPSPPHLLSLLSLLGALLTAAQNRGITPLEPFLIKQRLAIWPLFQKRMDDEAAALKALAERAAPGGGGLMGMVTGVSGSKVKDVKVQKVRRCALPLALIRQS